MQDGFIGLIIGGLIGFLFVVMVIIAHVGVSRNQWKRCEAMCATGVAKVQVDGDCFCNEPSEKP